MSNQKHRIEVDGYSFSEGEQEYRQRQFTERYVRLVREAMRRAGEPVPELDVDDGPADAVSQQLQLLIELRAEVAALRTKLDAS